eukprot:451344-Alexandrium_andersonii.AAC.1
MVSSGLPPSGSWSSSSDLWVYFALVPSSRPLSLQPGLICLSSLLRRMESSTNIGEWSVFSPALEFT